VSERASKRVVGAARQRHSKGVREPFSAVLESARHPVDRPGWIQRLLGKGERRDPEPLAIRKAAEAMDLDGAVVFANLDGWPRPPVVNGYIPDVYAVYEDREIILEFENDRSVEQAQALREDVAFASWADASEGREYDQIIVPGGRGGRG
jgi:hypothetical protein